MSGWVRGIDGSLLDPSDPDERRMLVELDHPELFGAIERGEPLETWEAAQRLRDLGQAALTTTEPTDISRFQ